MAVYLTKTNQTEIKILLAALDDKNSILLLNQKYLFQNIPFEELSNGFIKVQYTQNQLDAIINAKEIAIAQSNDCLIGYYLLGCNSDNEMLNYQKVVANQLAKSKLISIRKIGFGGQVCIDEPYHNKGLFASMLDQLIKSVSHKYDYLLCSVSDENSKSLKIHLKSGWELFEQFEGKNILIYKLLH